MIILMVKANPTNPLQLQRALFDQFDDIPRSERSAEKERRRIMLKAKFEAEANNLTVFEKEAKRRRKERCNLAVQIIIALAAVGTSEKPLPAQDNRCLDLFVGG